MPRVKSDINTSRDWHNHVHIPQMLQDAKEEWRKSCEVCLQAEDLRAWGLLFKDAEAKIQRHVIFTHLMPFLKSIKGFRWQRQVYEESNLLSQLHLEKLYQCFDGASCEDTNGFTFNILEFIEVNIDGVCNLTESILNDGSRRNTLQQLEVGDCMTDTTEQSPFHVKRIL